MKKPPLIELQLPESAAARLKSQLMTNQCLQAGMAPATRADELAMELHHLACEGFTEEQLYEYIADWCKDRTGIDPRDFGAFEDHGDEPA